MSCPSYIKTAFYNDAPKAFFGIYNMSSFWYQQNHAKGEQQ